MTLPIDIREEVADALSDGAPVVALETTIVTHGMPAPQNVDTALAVEADIREQDAVPATIAVVAGRLKIGLSQSELADLATASNVAKLSRADFAYVMSAGGTGSTTVAATMIAARLAKISVFATGGIGGAHRGSESDFDISADLQELAQTAVTVVSAGPKAILDIPATLEILETLGVPVFSYGQDELPAFWSRSSGLPSPLRADNPDVIANAAIMRERIGLPGGQLVANPIPREAEIPATELAPIIANAVRTAQEMGLKGKQVTPYLLGRIVELTQGASLTANIALIRNNAVLAAQIAKALARLR